MRKKTMISAAVCMFASMLAVAVSGRPALAHEEREVGNLSVEAGWMEEPVFTGLRNAVQFIATDAASGEPVEGGDLQAVVIFGPKEGSEQTDPIPLLPTEESPGEYDGAMIPTRPGTYTFHITGTVGTQTVDEFFTSGEQTFDDVVSAGEGEFPVKDPSTGELAGKLDRVATRVEAARDEAGSATDRAALAL
jgi:hypothetical protein